jgi:hypothetical protein
MPITIFIAGPMSGLPAFNHPAFYEAEDLLKNRHPFVEIINPARNVIHAWGGITKAEIWEEYMTISRDQVKQSDIVATLRGVIEEVALAKENGILITSVEALLK